VSAPDAERALPDEVHDAAVNAGADALVNLGTLHLPTVSGGTGLNLPAETIAQVVIDAAAQLLFAAGRASVLDAMAAEAWRMYAEIQADYANPNSAAPEMALVYAAAAYEYMARYAAHLGQPAPGAGAGRTDG